MNTPNQAVPEGTLRIEIHGVPTTQKELEALRGAISKLIFWEVELPAPEGEETNPLLGQFFCLPYEQGGGYVEITKTPEADLDEEAFATQFMREEGAEYTGYVFFDHYQDSMTSTYESPIFRDNPHDDADVSIAPM